jgi:hypothetical protein
MVDQRTEATEGRWLLHVVVQLPVDGHSQWPRRCPVSPPCVSVPPIEVTGDLDCGQIDYRRFQVIPPDPHGFDAEGDSVGCESD